MRIDQVYIQDFKNLKDFRIDLDEQEMYTVLLGQNAAGKSNFLEALVIIFRDLDLDNDPLFNYAITYQCNGKTLYVIADTGAKERKDRYRIAVKDPDDKSQLFQAAKKLSRTQFKRDKREYLPRYLIAYYSGVSNRLEEHFDQHQRNFYGELIDTKRSKETSLPMRPLFYARLIHSNFVLMSFFSFEEKDERVGKFLKEYFDVIGLDSVTFVIKRPEWAESEKKQRQIIKENEVSFWNANGVVSSFLKELYQIALAPIQDDIVVEKDYRKSEKKRDGVYLYLSNVKKLRKLAALYRSESGNPNEDFFKVLESTYISDLIQEVRVKVKKEKTDGTISFKELSEGEQQLLMVLGLLRFTKSEESLILLDEPDTHLNPLWKWRYLNLLRDIVEKPDSTQIIMTTHDPLVIGGLKKEEIRILYQQKKDGKIEAFEPDEDPKGMGVAAILTSELFGLPTTLDEDSQKNLNLKRSLEIKRASGIITPDETQELIELEKELKSRGIVYSISDPLYQRFISAAMQMPQFQKPALTREEQQEQEKLAQEILKKILEEEKP